jgi:cytochrome c oxidase subunit II
MHSFFDPSSPHARAVAHLWWWMLGVGGAIWIGVTIAAIYAGLARRGRREADDLLHIPADTHHRLERVVSVSVVATSLILVAFLAYDFTVGRVLAQHPQRGMTIDVTGHQWWWEVLYEDPDPSRQLLTANEIHVPVGEPIQFKLRAADVIHSFWAPNLDGKRDLIPGYMSTIWFKADTPGVYRGQCAEFCGLQHAKMAFYVVAQPRQTFNAWFAAASQSHQTPTDSTLLSGERVFLSSGCAVCHTISGTQAFATVGPNLSHFGSRSTIAAGTLPNTKENLARWIFNPQLIKPGVIMPQVPLQPAQLTAVVAYLESLK